jgi:NNP family nitrate/nitrite transporter-like MFS transporter
MGEPTFGREVGTLAAAFLHFTTSCMVWALPGAVAIFIGAEVKLSAGELGLVVAVPILSGSLLRIPLGGLADRVGERRVGAVMLLLLLLPLLMSVAGGRSFVGLLAIGAMLGVAGASFAVALPLASRWYPAERQGLVLGLVASGNSGTVITYLAAPALAERMGWRLAAAVLALPILATLGAFLALARDAPARPVFARRPSLISLVRETDLWMLGGLYAVTFGGYVGLSASLPILLRDQYAAGAVGAGSITALAGLFGGLTRPLGGHLADRVGGARLLVILLLALAVAYHFAAALPPLPQFAALLCVAMLCMGLGNGAVFQLVPGRFPHQLGSATGLIGAVGGTGGFLVPLLFGVVRESGGTFVSALGVLAVTCLTAAGLLVSLMLVHARWRTSWVTPGVGLDPIT